jgi:hypothetical protein
VAYNMRFAAAFERQRVSTWPYNGSVLIREDLPGLAGSSGYVVDNWCLLMSLRELEDGTVESEDLTDKFDLDSYRIIKRYMENPSHRRRISPLSAREAQMLASSSPWPQAV